VTKIANHSTDYFKVEMEYKKRNVVNIRSNSNGMHNSSYILIGTDDGKIKVIFGSPEKYEYNPTNIEKAELIFVEQPKSK